MGVEKNINPNFSCYENLLTGLDRILKRYGEYDLLNEKFRWRHKTISRIKDRCLEAKVFNFDYKVATEFYKMESENSITKRFNLPFDTIFVNFSEPLYIDSKEKRGDKCYYRSITFQNSEFCRCFRNR